MERSAEHTTSFDCMKIPIKTSLEGMEKHLKRVEKFDYETPENTQVAPEWLFEVFENCNLKLMELV